MTDATGLGDVGYTSARSYQLSTWALRSPAFGGKVAALTFALHAIYTALGHRAGGTTITDAQVARWLGVGTKTIQRARAVLYDYDLFTVVARQGMAIRRKTKRPSTFVHVPGLVVRALLSGAITVGQFRLYAWVVHRRAESGESAGCGLTRAELARELRVRESVISADVAALIRAGLLHRQGQNGRGWVLIPQYARAVVRKVAAVARHQLKARRAQWNLPRPGSVDNPRGTPARIDHYPRAGLTTPAPVPEGYRPRPEQVGSHGPLERGVSTMTGPAPWDVPGKVWAPDGPPDLPARPFRPPAGWRGLVAAITGQAG